MGFRDQRPEGTGGAKLAVMSSVKPLHPASDNLIDRTRKVWKPRFRRDLSRADARQIAENATGFFTILAEWSHAEVPVPANDATKPSASDSNEVSDEC